METDPPLDPGGNGLPSVPSVKHILAVARDCIARELAELGETTDLKSHFSVTSPASGRCSGTCLVSSHIPSVPFQAKASFRESEEDALLKLEPLLLARKQQMESEGTWLPGRRPALADLASSQRVRRNKTHWDYLLDEMMWLSADYDRERKLKTAETRKLSRAVLKYHASSEIRENRRRDAEERKLRSIAFQCAKAMRQFWNRAEAIVQLKAKKHLEEKQKEVARRKQDILLTKTEHFAQIVRESLHSASGRSLQPASNSNNNVSGLSSDKEPNSANLPVEATMVANDSQRRKRSSVAVSHVAATIASPETSVPEVSERPSKKRRLDVDYVLDGLDQEDVEDTIEEDEHALGIKDSMDYADEAAALAAEADMDLEMLLSQYVNAGDGLDEEVQSGPSAHASDFDDNVDDDDVDVDDDDGMAEAESDLEGECAASDVEEVEISAASTAPPLSSSSTVEHTSVEDLAAVSRSAEVAERVSPTPVIVDPGRSRLLNSRLSLRDYQCTGVRWLLTLYEHNLNGILADEMGLGKTIQTIALFAHLAENHGDWGPHIVIVPSSVLLSWEMECRRWAPGLKVLAYYGSRADRQVLRKGWSRPNSVHVLLTSYAIALQDAQILRRKKFSYLVLDEAHHIKNFLSKRWQVLLTLRARHRLLLTGTPLQNSLLELWSLLHFLMPQLFRSHTEFQQWFRLSELSGAEGEAQRAEGEMVRRLHKLLAPFLLRRLKRDVEKTLPAKVEHLLPAPLSKRQMILYEEFMSRSDTKSEILQRQSMLGMMNVLMQLRKVCNHPDLFEQRPIVSSLDLPLLGSDDAWSRCVHAGERCCLVLRQVPSFCAFYGSLPLPVSLSPSASRRLPQVVTPALPDFGHGLSGSVDADGILFQQVEKWVMTPTSPLFAIIREQHQGRSGGNTAGCAAANRLSEFRWLLYDHFANVMTAWAVDRVSSPTDGSSATSSFFERVRRSIWDEIAPEAMLTEASVVIPRVRVAQLPDSLPLNLPIPPIVPFIMSSMRTGMINVDHEIGRLTHQTMIRQTLFFPDRRLLQFDCGKLQVLSRLLRQLHATKDSNGKRHKVLLFTQMSRMLDILEQFLDMHGFIHLRLDGSTKPEQRLLLMERFNRDPAVFVFLLSTRAGGVGMNLTGADNVVFYDTDWNPAMDAQAQDRCHRIGQTREVHIHRIVTRRTVEEAILKRALEKRKMAFKVLGDESRRHDAGIDLDASMEHAVVDTDVTSAFSARNIIHDLKDVFMHQSAEWLKVGAPELSVNGREPPIVAAQVSAAPEDPDVGQDISILEDPEDRVARENLEKEIKEDEREFDRLDADASLDGTSSVQKSDAVNTSSVVLDSRDAPSADRLMAFDESIMESLSGVGRLAVLFVEQHDDRLSRRFELALMEESARQEELALEEAIRDWRIDHQAGKGIRGQVNHDSDNDSAELAEDKDDANDVEDDDDRRWFDIVHAACRRLLRTQQIPVDISSDDPWTLHEQLVASGLHLHELSNINDLDYDSSVAADNPSLRENAIIVDFSPSDSGTSSPRSGFYDHSVGVATNEANVQHRTSVADPHDVAVSEKSLKQPKRKYIRSRTESEILSTLTEEEAAAVAQMTAIEIKKFVKEKQVAERLKRKQSGSSATDKNFVGGPTPDASGDASSHPPPSDKTGAPAVVQTSGIRAPAASDTDIAWTDADDEVLRRYGNYFTFSKQDTSAVARYSIMQTAMPLTETDSALPEVQLSESRGSSMGAWHFISGTLNGPTSLVSPFPFRSSTTCAARYNEISESPRSSSINNLSVFSSPQHLPHEFDGTSLHRNSCMSTIPSRDKCIVRTWTKTASKVQVVAGIRRDVKRRLKSGGRLLKVKRDTVRPAQILQSVVDGEITYVSPFDVVKTAEDGIPLRAGLHRLAQWQFLQALPPLPQSSSDATPKAESTTEDVPGDNEVSAEDVPMPSPVPAPPAPPAPTAPHASSASSVPSVPSAPSVLPAFPVPTAPSSAVKHATKGDKSSTGKKRERKKSSVASVVDTTADRESIMEEPGEPTVPDVM